MPSTSTQQAALLMPSPTSVPASVHTVAPQSESTSIETVAAALAELLSNTSSASEIERMPAPARKAKSCQK